MRHYRWRWKDDSTLADISAVLVVVVVLVVSLFLFNCPAADVRF